MSDMQKRGKVSWKDNALGGGSGEKQYNPELFLRLSPGSNLIRILTEPFQYFQHKYKFFEGEKGFGHRIACSAPNGSCIVCEQGDKPKKRWFLGVIERKTNTYKILDINWSVLSDINTYANDDDWGDPSEYDFDIVVNPQGGPQHYYKAVAKPKKPLSASDLAIKEKDVNLAELERKCQPPEPAKTTERFLMLKENAMKSKGDNGSSKDDAVSFKNSDEMYGSKNTDDLPF